MNTRKHPRTMQEAFGPYCSHKLEAKKGHKDVADMIIFASCCVVLLVIFALFVIR